MESWNPRDCENECPSQENLAHSQSLKRDGESLEDFEDITKDEPSMKDLTAQFLHFESGNRSNTDQEGEKFSLPDNNQFFSEPKSSDSVDVKYNSEKVNQMSENLGNLVPSEPSVQMSDRENVLNNLYGFEQTDLQDEQKNLEKFQEESILNIVDDKKLIDVSDNENSAGSDIPSFTQKEGESFTLNSEPEKDAFKIPTAEFKSSEETDIFLKSQLLSKFTSESDKDKDKEKDVEVFQKDELYVKQSSEAEASDNDDEFIPEPIPKDYPEIGVIEGKQFLAAIGLDAWFHPDLLHPKVESLIYWRDPKKSGVVFGGILIVLLSLTSFSLISVIAYTSLIALFAALAFRIYKSVMQAVQKTSEGHPFKEYLDIDLTVSPEKAREISDVVVSYINRGVTECRRLFLIEDVIDSIKFGVLLWSLTYIGAWFNGLSLLIIAFVGLFTLPKVYENNKTQIDANMDVVKAKINEVTEKIAAVIPLGKKTEDIKDKAE